PEAVKETDLKSWLRSSGREWVWVDRVVLLSREPGRTIPGLTPLNLSLASRNLHRRSQAAKISAVVAGSNSFRYVFDHTTKSGSDACFPKQSAQSRRYPPGPRN